MSFQISIPVHFSDSDKTGRMSAKSVLRAMLESSMRHTDQIENKADDKDVWVLFRWEVEFFDFPLPGNQLTAETYTTGFHKFYAYREFVLSLGDETIAQAKSTWLLLDGQTLRPKRVSEEVAKQYGRSPSHFAFDEFSEMNDAGIPPSDEFSVRSFHIDGNGHVNNLVYVDWVIEAVPYEFRESHRLKSLSLTYRKQVFYPERIVARSMIQPEGVWTILREKENNDLRAWAVTTWTEERKNCESADAE